MPGLSRWAHCNHQGPCQTEARGSESKKKKKKKCEDGSRVWSLEDGGKGPQA